MPTTARLLNRPFREVNANRVLVRPLERIAFTAAVSVVILVVREDICIWISATSVALRRTFAIAWRV